MSALVDCPHCSTRVLPMAGRACPACQKNVDAPPDPEPPPERVAAAAYDLAAEQMRGGVTPLEIEKGLAARGMDAVAASKVVDDLRLVEAHARREVARKHMFYGAAWCVGGIVVTA